MSDETVKVRTSIPNGVMLRIADRVDSLEVPGTKVPREIATMGIGGGPEPTEVNAEHFALWLKENENSDLVKSGAIFKHEDAEKAAEASDEFTKEAHETPGVPDHNPNHTAVPEIVPVPEDQFGGVKGKPAPEMSEAELDKATRPEPKKD